MDSLGDLRWLILFHESIQNQVSAFLLCQFVHIKFTSKIRNTCLWRVWFCPCIDYDAQVFTKILFPKHRLLFQVTKLAPRIGFCRFVYWALISRHRSWCFCWLIRSACPGFGECSRLAEGEAHCRQRSTVRCDACFWTLVKESENKILLITQSYRRRASSMLLTCFRKFSI